jgi:hypothetical protein
MSSTHIVHVNNLPAETRARLVDCLGRRGLGDFAPLLERRFGWRIPLACAAVGAVLAAVGISHVWTVGYGVPGHPGARLGLVDMALLAALVAAPLAAFGLAVRRAAVRRRLPFAPGIYVVGPDLVDARGAVLRITSIANTRFTATHQHLNGVYVGTDFDFATDDVSHRFRVPRREQAEATLASLRATRVAFLGAVQRQDMHALSRLDVFFAARTSPAWGQLGARRAAIPPPDGHVARVAPWPLRWAPVIGIAVGVAIAPPLWWHRNASSDDAMFAAALAAFRARARDPRALAFADRLLAFQEQASSPPVTLQVRPPRPESLAAMDERVAPAMRDREGAIAAGLAAGFRDCFAGDVLAIERAAAGAPGPRASIEVAYQVSPMTTAGGAPAMYTETGADRGRLFVGIRIAFDVAMRVPGDAEPYRLRFEVLPPEHFTVPRPAPGATADVYRIMADRAFDRLRTELASAFFAAAP